MKNFSNWIAKDAPVQPNLTLLLLGHHDNDRIYWGETDTIPASLFSANFQQPSVVVFNACGTAKPGETHLLKNLNQHGVSTVIATYSEVPGAMAGKFSSLMIYNLHQHKSDVGYSLAQAVFDSTLQLRGEPIPSSPGIPAGAKYGAFALL